MHCSSLTLNLLGHGWLSQGRDGLKTFYLWPGDATVKTSPDNIVNLFVKPQMTVKGHSQIWNLLLGMHLITPSDTIGLCCLAARALIRKRITPSDTIGHLLLAAWVLKMSLSVMELLQGRRDFVFLKRRSSTEPEIEIIKAV